MHRQRTDPEIFEGMSFRETLNNTVVPIPCWNFVFRIIR